MLAKGESFRSSAYRPDCQNAYAVPYAVWCALPEPVLDAAVGATVLLTQCLPFARLVIFDGSDRASGMVPG